MLNEYLALYLIITTSLLLAVAYLHLLPRLGSFGRKVANTLCHAPALDLGITYFTIAPALTGYLWLGWKGLLLGIAAQITAVMIWTPLHELAHPAARKGPRIVHTMNRVVGRWRNHTAVWITALAIPVFWIVRLAEWIVYPPLIVLIKFPRYRSADWVNVSRQKFEGLVGHDLIWCLYCDWMTGVWSLGSEMLRNVESFWCPIRFYSDKKCDNCKIDFPDINGGWAATGSGMASVTAALDKHYKPDNTENSWFGHPTRLTINGKDASPKS